jgi:hypothetical protein
VIDEEDVFVRLCFPVKPELIFGYVMISVVLAEVREFFVDVAANVCAIYYPDLIITPCFILLQIRWFKLLCRSIFSLS